MSTSPSGVRALTLPEVPVTRPEAIICLATRATSSRSSLWFMQTPARRPDLILYALLAAVLFQRFHDVFERPDPGDEGLGVHPPALKQFEGDLHGVGSVVEDAPDGDLGVVQEHGIHPHG